MQRARIVLVVALLGVAGIRPPVGAQPINNANQAITAIAERLVSDQQVDGSWAGEEYFTGSMVIGLVDAYKRTCEPSYLAAAELAGDYINAVSGGYYGYGDEALAMAMLSGTAADPSNNPYRDDLAYFYSAIKAEGGGTAAFIDDYTYGAEPSTAVFYIAFHTIAAHYVEAEDAGLFREALLGYLATVDDSTADFPVMALGIATWALAESGQMNDAPVDADGTGRPMWTGLTLADLPELLLAHQSSKGAFYWRFDHTDGAGSALGVTSGFTEDAIFGTLGLISADKYTNHNFRDEIGLAKKALWEGVNADGTVYGHLWQDSPDMKVYAAEMLAALSGLGRIPANCPGMCFAKGDSNRDCQITFTDVQAVIDAWPPKPYRWNADFNQDGQITFSDVNVLIQHWPPNAGCSATCVPAP
ncbi:MAG: hypothetical protein IH624_03370 [Phycisphaerae bacterium]|nr:hypothetical protein [Phycisphaerae bacterium]